MSGHNLRLLTIFTLILSMMSLVGANPERGLIHVVRADYLPAPIFAQNSGPVPTSPDNEWVPAGPMVDRIIVSLYSDPNGEFGALKNNSIDETDWTLSFIDAPSSCPSGSAIACDSRFWVNHAQGTDQIVAYDMFGVDFNYANTFFGIYFGLGRDTNVDNDRAIHFRQGIAHLVSRQDVVTNFFGPLANEIDNPLPPGQGFIHSGRPFDSTCMPAPNCVGPYSYGGYNLQGVCGSGSGTVNGGWDSLDAQFRAAGQTCKSAFKYGTDTVDSAGIVTASASNPDFCDAADHWIAAGVATGKALDCSLKGFQTSNLLNGNIKFVLRRDDIPRLNFGQRLASRMCELINGAGVTTCTQIAVSYAPGAPQLCICDPGIPNVSWHMYTSGWAIGSSPEQIWTLYNSQFSDSCNGTFTQSPSNYLYFCNQRLDHYGSMIEFNSTSGGQLASLQMANEIFGNHTVGISIYSHHDVFAYRKEWRGMVQANGVGNPSYFAQLNSWSPTPLSVGSLRWGWTGGINSPNLIRGDITNPNGITNPNPMSYTSKEEYQFNHLVYDSLIATNPYSPNDAFGWMINQWQVLAPQPGDPFGTVSDLKFSLRNDVFFHDGKQVTASDYSFSWQAFAGTNGLNTPLTMGIVGVRVQNDFSFVVNLNSNSVLALFKVGSIPILPQHILAADTTTKCETVGTRACTIYAGADTADLVANYQFIGSGPFVCLDQSTNQVGGKCTPTGTGTVNPALNSGNIILTRDGYGQAGTSNSAYFRSSAKYKQWQWADAFSHGTVDILDVSSAASCLGKLATASGCTHWDTPAAHISCVTAAGSCDALSLAGLGGNNGGTVTFLEITQAFRWFGTSWTSPISYASLSSTTGCGGTGCGAEALATQTLFEGGIQYNP